jgi:hypothetical protein
VGENLPIKNTEFDINDFGEFKRPCVRLSSCSRGVFSWALMPIGDRLAHQPAQGLHAQWPHSAIEQDRAAPGFGPHHRSRADKLLLEMTMNTLEGKAKQALHRPWVGASWSPT